MIRLRFVQGSGIGSALISWFSQGHLSHVDAIMPDGTLLGARSDNIGGGRGVRKRPYPYEKVRRIEIWEIPASIEKTAAFYGYLASQIGKPYDYEAIAGFFLNRSWRDEGSWVCSELQAAALEKGTVMPLVAMAVNKITPVMLTALVSEIPGARIVVGR